MKNLIKNATRHLVIKAYETFTKGKKNISVLSLPGNVWEFENYVLSNRDFGFKFGGWYALDMTLVERDEVVFKRNLAGSNLVRLLTRLPLILLSNTMLHTRMKY